MIKVTQDIVIDEGELEEQFIRVSGPGGQHVNKAATAVQLRFDVAHSPSRCGSGAADLVGWRPDDRGRCAGHRGQPVLLSSSQSPGCQSSAVQTGASGGQETHYPPQDQSRTWVAEASPADKTAAE